MSEDFITHIVKTNELERVDKYLSNTFSDMSRSMISLLIDNEDIKVNSQKVKPSFKIKEGDIITIKIIKPKEVETKKEELNLDIVFEDDDIVIVNKPKNMVVHPAPGNYESTLVNGLLYEIDNLSGINGELRPGIVHRIDKDTTGLLVVAKNDNAHKFLSSQLEAHTVNRVYVCLVHGVIKESKGRIEAPLGRSKSDRKKMAVVKHGKRAVTNFIVLKNFSNYTLLECRLETGRTHQIRVHLQYIGHPVVGDKVYGPKKASFDDGQLLHAKTLGFIHPTTKEYIEFTSDIPKFFLDFIDNIDK